MAVHRRRVPRSDEVPKKLNGRMAKSGVSQGRVQALDVGGLFESINIVVSIHIKLVYFIDLQDN